ncbi:ROK family transcriptional regulator [Paragemmobacter straminiformis]|uniref:ROK family transcriptional regulator n=1 Tax=Paragemmobacter straminiformis TaxID=2045119 RepID=A0A842I8I2_9RHOB|nr:ROK family transcriptional regulator [Gemmobacter straminiformis]MBC2835926.1 ROK family transcriptional regulator [Gemmobacter straminiformis]
MTEILAFGSSPRRIRQANVVAALQSLFGFGRLSRAELARKLGLNRSSSGHIVAELTESGLVREVEDDAAKRPDQARAGRPGILLELIPDAALFLGIEIGVEHIAAVVIDLTGKVRARASRPFTAPGTPIESAVQAAADLGLGALGPSGLGQCQGIGLSVPAHIYGEGIVAIAPLIGWQNIPLGEIARSLLPLNVPVTVENDANAFAIGDGYKHKSSGVTLFLVLETGVGGGIVIDGKLFRGGHGLAGEIGHTLVPGSNGKKLEQLIGREAVLSQYRSATGRSDADLDTFLTDVNDRVPAAVNVAEDWSRNLAYALMQACRVIDPERIVLGGSVAALYPMVAARLAAHMGSERNAMFPVPDILVDDDPHFGSAFGAACLMHQRFLSLSNDSLALDDTSEDERDTA